MPEIASALAAHPAVPGASSAGPHSPEAQAMAVSRAWRRRGTGPAPVGPTTDLLAQRIAQTKSMTATLAARMVEAG